MQVSDGLFGGRGACRGRGGTTAGHRELRHRAVVHSPGNCPQDGQLGDKSMMVFSAPNRWSQDKQTVHKPTQVTSKPFLDLIQPVSLCFQSQSTLYASYSEETSVYMFACGVSQLNLGSWELKRDICEGRKHNSDCYQDKQPTVSAAPLSHQQPAAK